MRRKYISTPKMPSSPDYPVSSLGEAPTQCEHDHVPSWSDNARKMFTALVDGKHAVTHLREGMCVGCGCVARVGFLLLLLFCVLSLSRDLIMIFMRHCEAQRIVEMLGVESI